MQYNNIYKPLRGGLLFVAILFPGFPACLRISWKPDEVLLRAGLYSGFIMRLKDINRIYALF